MQRNDLYSYQEPNQEPNNDEWSVAVRKFLHSEELPGFEDAADRVWRRLELRGFEPLRPSGRMLSAERLFGGYRGSVQGVAAAAALALVFGATLLLMHSAQRSGALSFDGTTVDELETHTASALSVEDILRLLAEGREAPPVTIQIPHTGPFERRGAPALRVGAEISVQQGTQQDSF